MGRLITQDYRGPQLASWPGVRRRDAQGTASLPGTAAGTMAGNRSGLQWSTVRNLLMAWVLTLPMAIVLSGSLYWLFSKLL